MDHSSMPLICLNLQLGLSLFASAAHLERYHLLLHVCGKQRPKVLKLSCEEEGVGPPAVFKMVVMGGGEQRLDGGQEKKKVLEIDKTEEHGWLCNVLCIPTNNMAENESQHKIQDFHGYIHKSSISSSSSSSSFSSLFSLSPLVASFASSSPHLLFGNSALNSSPTRS